MKKDRSETFKNQGMEKREKKEEQALSVVKPAQASQVYIIIMA